MAPMMIATCEDMKISPSKTLFPLAIVCIATISALPLGSGATRKIPMTEDVYRCFQGILEDRETPTVEKIVDGYSGFLFLDKEGLPEVAMHWEHRFNHMVKRYNEIYRV